MRAKGNFRRELTINLWHVVEAFLSTYSFHNRLLDSP